SSCHAAQALRAGGRIVVLGGLRAERRVAVNATATTSRPLDAIHGYAGELDDALGLANMNLDLLRSRAVEVADAYEERESDDVVRAHAFETVGLLAAIVAKGRQDLMQLGLWYDEIQQAVDGMSLGLDVHAKA